MPSTIPKQPLVKGRQKLVSDTQIELLAQTLENEGILIIDRDSKIKAPK